jgi:hypothetical protein
MGRAHGYRSNDSHDQRVPRTLRDPDDVLMLATVLIAGGSGSPNANLRPSAIDP